jgi:pimeloyl-ACP methyl ester carboxylesterase
MAAARTYVLVHGAWHGGWCWARVAPRLRDAGHVVHTPSLTGLGDRDHLFAAGVGLATHVEDVLRLIEAEEPEGELVLVGHSYGGNVVSGVADVLRERITHCVFLDAVVPPSGTTSWRWADFNTPQDRERRLAAVAELGAGVALPAPAPDVFAVNDPADAAWLRRRLRPMPIGTYLGRIELRAGGSDGLPRTYVAAAAPPFASMRPVIDRIRTDPSWRFCSLDTGHDMMVTAPGPLTDLLLAV